MKYCPYCGKRINASVKFCPYCGKPQPQYSTSAQPTQSSQMTNVQSSRSGLNVMYFALITTVLSALFCVYFYNKIARFNVYTAYLDISNDGLIISILTILNIVMCALEVYKGIHSQWTKSAGIVSIIGTLITMVPVMQCLSVPIFDKNIIPLGIFYTVAAILFIYSIIRYGFNIKKLRKSTTPD